jgi:Chaperone of endosialidase
MSPSIRSKKAIPLCLVTLVCFAVSPVSRAVSPPPDGGYPGANTAEGDDALLNLTSGSDNTAIGFETLFNDTSGLDNTAVGSGALYSNTTGNDNTAIGEGVLNQNTSGFGNTATGIEAMLSNTTGSNNTATGNSALNANLTGTFNTANGAGALFNNTIGSNNTATGLSALANNISGSNNTASGFEALLFNRSGNNNIAVGATAGENIDVGSNNIDIGNVGMADESNAIRIGAKRIHQNTFIAGIHGTTVAGGIGVIIDGKGHLGTATSSARFKDEIKPMDKASEAIFGLKPVTFRYKHELDPENIPEFGLVAEQVEKINPDLVACDDEGKPYTVRYEAVNAMLLNEFLKAHRRIEEQDGRLQKQETAIAKQQKQIEALTTGLQKVSDQLELSKPAPQIVGNNR